jgi:hypothetical protein
MGEESPEASLEEPQTHIAIKPIGPPLKPPSHLYKAAKDWGPKFFKSGKEYIDEKRQAWARLKRMMTNELPFDAWYWPESEIDTYIKQRSYGIDEEPLRKRTNETISIAQYVHHFAEGAFQAVFQSEPWFSITAEATVDEPSVEDLRFSTAQKMENLMARYFRKAFFKEAAYQVFQWVGLLGSCGGMVRWHEKSVRQYFKAVEVDQFGNAKGDAKVFSENKTVCAEPLFDVLPPDKVYVDPTATTSDVQKWYGVGTCSKITRAEVMARFESKVFTLNEKEFKKRWGEPGSAGGSDPTSEDIAYDNDRSELDEAIDNLKIWQYHGLIPTDKGDIESVAVWITEKGADNCDDGVLVKLHEGTALHCGLRPAVWAQYTPWVGPYGLGTVQPHFSKVWMISHLQNLLTDCLELVVNPRYQIVENSVAHRSLMEKDGDVAYPGQNLLVGQIDKEVKSYPLAQVDLGALSAHLQQLRGEFQMETGVDDNTLGVSNREKTATEVSRMTQQAAGPLSVRLEMLGETFLDPTCTLFLNTVQQYELSDQVISVIDGQGMPTTVTLTADELKTGKYLIQSVITSEDTNRIAVIQSLERILPQLPNLKQMLNSEGYDLKQTPIVREYFGRNRIPRLAQIITPLPPQPEQPMGPDGMPMDGQGAMPPPGMEGPPMPPGAGPMGPPMPAQATAPTGSLNDFRGPMGDGSDEDMLFKQLQDVARIAEGMSMQQ